MSDAPVSEQQVITPAVTRVRARLARIAGRALLRRRAAWALGFAALLAALRPLLWPLEEDAPLYLGLVRAAILAIVSFALVASALLYAGRRRRPSPLGAARAVDEALGLHEVVGSGFAFERDGRDDAGGLVARRRAAAAVKGLDVASAFRLPSLRPARRRIAPASIGLVAALTLGAYDRVLAGALIAPPTADERAAAADLEASAQALAAALAPVALPKHPEAPKSGQAKEDEKSPSAGPKLVEKAREAARAARRGDRQGALGKLDTLRTDGRKQAARASDLKAALRQIADALDPPKSGARGGAARALDPSAQAADTMRLLAKKMRSSEEAASETKESQERTLERLSRAGDEARKSGGDKADQKDAAESLSRAAEALSRGDREAAAQMLDRAAERAEAMERERAEAAAEAQAILEMLEKSGVLEEAIEMAMLGREGQGKPGEGEGLAMGEGGEGEGGDKPGSGSGKGAGKKGLDLRRALASRLAAVGFGDTSSSGRDASGSIPDRRRTKREALEIKESRRAPSEVGEGERAIQAIQGLGKGSDPPKAYREVFPSYDAAVEEGLADERIPAARRAAVRKYFQSIRPVDP